MHGAERPHGRLTDGNALRLVEIGSAFSIGPVGPVEAAARRPLFHPGEDLGGHSGRDGGRPARRPLHRQAVEAPDAIGIEPALQGPCRDAQVCRDVVMGPRPVSHEDGLAPVTQAAVCRVFESLFQLLSCRVAQSNADYRCLLPQGTLGG